MTVANTAFQSTGTGDGVTLPFGFNWPILTDSATPVGAASVAVYVNGVKKALGADYSLTTNAATTGIGGTVTFLVAPAAAAAILIQREMDELQSDSLVNNQAMPPATVMRMVDKLCMNIQAALRSLVGADTAFAAGQLYTFPHALGKVPSKVQLCLVCKTPDGGYAVGDVIDAPASAIGTIQRDMTNVYIRTLSVLGTVNVANKGTFVSTPITPATNWNLRVYSS